MAHIATLSQLNLYKINKTYTLKIVLKDFDSQDITLSNDSLDNDNFVEMVIGETVVVVSIDDMHHALNLFSEVREQNMRRDLMLNKKNEL